MLCKCGCQTEFQPSSATLYRIKNGLNSGYISGHQTKGRDNPRWKGGRFISANGYVYLLRPEHPNALKKGTPGYIAEHRLEMSQHLGRPLKTEELVHHKNGNKLDNRIENLVIIARPSHAAMHTSGSSNGNWSGGRQEITCHTCGTHFLPNDRRNDYGAKYCSRQCYYARSR